MKKLPALIALPFFLLVTCYFSPYSGYSKINRGLYMQLIMIGDNDKQIKSGDFLTAHLRYSTMDDSVFFEAVRKFRLDPPDREGSLENGLMLLGEGDSAGFILEIPDFFEYTLEREVPEFLVDEENMKINVRIREVQTPEEYQAEKEQFLRWAKEFQSTEMELVRNYLEENKLNVKPDEGGIYFLSHEKGEGEPVEEGKHVWIHYEGKFLNGNYVDNTRSRNAPIDFVYGSDMYLIEGLETAIGKMSEGGKAMVLIPSEFGFGSRGSVQGIVPPYTSLIYMVEVVKVE